MIDCWKHERLAVGLWSWVCESPGIGTEIVTRAGTDGYSAFTITPDIRPLISTLLLTKWFIMSNSATPPAHWTGVYINLSSADINGGFRYPRVHRNVMSTSWHLSSRRNANDSGGPDFVSLSGDRQPRHVFVFFLSNSRFWVRTLKLPTSPSTSFLIHYNKTVVRFSTTCAVKSIVKKARRK
jgi:hypothetical protein